MSSITEMIVALADGVSEKNDTSIYSTGAYVLAGNDAGTDIYDGLFRWQALDLPQSASILTATFRPYLGAISANSFKGALKGIDEDNTVVWASDDRASQRSKTTATVSADAADWSDYTAGNWISIDVTAIIQEIVDRSGWEVGNDLALVLISDHDVGNDDQISLHRYYGSYIQDPLTYSPQLIIEYGDAPTADWTPVLTSIIR